MANLCKLVVKKLNDQSFAFTNSFLHNPEHFNGEKEMLLKLGDGTVYPSIASNVSTGSIEIGGTQRIHHNIHVGQELLFERYDPKDAPVEDLSIILTSFKTSKIISDIKSVHKDNFKEYLVKRFAKHYFYKNQKLVVDFDGSMFKGEVVSNSEGYINDETLVQLASTDISISIIDQNLLNRELFKDDFNFEDIGIGGLNSELVGIFRRALSSRGIKPSIVEKLGIKHIKGLMLHGPPGTGKTLIARKIGRLLTKNDPIIVNGPELLNKYVGQSEENIRNIFMPARRDYQINKHNASLHIIIFDEIDAICKQRGKSGTQSSVTDSLVNQLLTIIDGVEEFDNFFVIAMTNRLDLVDTALIRPGRLEMLVKIGLPDFEGRKQIYRIHTQKMKNNHMVGDIDTDYLAGKSENFSGAEIEAVIKNAASYAVHNILASNKSDIDDSDIFVTMDDFIKSVDEIKPAFGNQISEYRSLVPDNYVQLTDSHIRAFADLKRMINGTQRFKTVLIRGEPGTGKSTFVTKFALESNVKYSRLVRPINVIRMDEYDKSNLLTDTLMDAYISENSLVIFDDIEVLINFADLGSTLSFSNKLYQTLVTLLKTTPTNISNRLMIVCTCGNYKLADILQHQFDKVYELDKIKYENIKDINEKLNLDINLAFNTDMTIKDILS